MLGDTCHAGIATREFKEMVKNMGCVQVRETRWRSQLAGTHLLGNTCGCVRWVCPNSTSGTLTPLGEESGPFPWGERKAEVFFLFCWGFSYRQFKTVCVGVSFLSYRNVRVVINCLTLIKQWKRFQITFLKARWEKKQNSFLPKRSESVSLSQI